MSSERASDTTVAPVARLKSPPKRVLALLLVLAAHPVAALGLWWLDQAGLADLLGPGKTPGFGLAGYLLLLGFISAACKVPLLPIGFALLAYACALGLDFADQPLLEIAAATGWSCPLMQLILGVLPVLVGAVLTYDLPRVPWFAKPAFWVAGVYIAAVHVYNGLDPYGYMGLFWAGERI